MRENADRLFVDETTELIDVGNTTVELVCKYTGSISFIELLKSAMKRDIETALSGLDNPS